MPVTYRTSESIRQYKNQWNAKRRVENLKLLRAELSKVLADEKLDHLLDVPIQIVRAITQLRDYFQNQQTEAFTRTLTALR